MKRAIIIGAGPAGLTAAYELATRTDIKPIVLEMSEHMGGIARTDNYKGNRMDIGGHRFFSKSNRVMEWWLDKMPLQKLEPGRQQIAYQRKTTEIKTGEGPDPDKQDEVMLVRKRKSRIYFLRQFFRYPITIDQDTVGKLGMKKTMQMGLSYMYYMLNPVKPEKSLEDFITNRFGKELYETFFKSYTEKVWGVPCNEISAEWGAQRIKGLSISKAISHYLRQFFINKNDVAQKKTETSLIENFLYPKLGPGQMWEEVAKKVKHLGGEIGTNRKVRKIILKDGKVHSVKVYNSLSQEEELYEGDYFFSTMPVKELVNGMQPEAPANVKEVANNLVYRDFITVGLLLNKLKIRKENEDDRGLIRDNWIYIQEPDVHVGRLQIFNNWSPYLVADPEKVWVGMEYFCYETDKMWNLPEKEMVQFAIDELAKIDIIEKSEVLDAHVIKMPKTYPAYFGSYGRFDEIREFTDQIPNLFLVGRNGMHKYNNQDHSMLTAMVAVDNIIAGIADKSNIWAVNTEQEYHEEK